MHGMEREWCAFGNVLPHQNNSMLPLLQVFCQSPMVVYYAGLATIAYQLQHCEDALCRWQRLIINKLCLIGMKKFHAITVLFRVIILATIFKTAAG